MSDPTALIDEIVNKYVISDYSVRYSIVYKKFLSRNSWKLSLY